MIGNSPTFIYILLKLPLISPF